MSPFGKSAPALNRCVELFDLRFDCLTLDGAAVAIVNRPVIGAFQYVVTANVLDVVGAVAENRDLLLPIYRSAWMCVCDSRILRLLGRLRAIDLSVVPGSTLVTHLFDRYIRPDDAITIIGGSTSVIAALCARYGLTRVAHHNPPMGFINDPSAVEACVEFVVAHPARYVFLVVGVPQQQILGARIAATGRAVGTGLCVGAALNFLVGVEKRAPGWIQACNLEWLFRLLSDPRRLWRRYLIRCPRIFAIFWATRKRRLA